jgi:predicted GNAT family acetyltransferase
MNVMSDPGKSNVTRSRFELEEEGEIAWLEFETDSEGWITLLHTEVPAALRGRGLANVLAQTGLEYARDHKLKVDVICPLVATYVAKNPEFQALVGR